MDNLTHTLAGMLVAEAACAFRKKARTELRVAAYVTSALANNLPDIDPIYTWITGPKPLGSLLHHRGHTHTLLLALPAGCLLAAAILRRFERNGAFARDERRLVYGLGAGGAALHIGMDFGNNYGVHPFWPFVSSWFYGDSIFIVEPLWWAIALPALAFAVQSRWLRAVFATLLAALIAASALLPFITRGTLAAVLLLAASSAAAARLGSARARIAAACSGWLAIATTFVVASSRAEDALTGAVTRDFPALAVNDVALSPMPGNPFCWNALVVGTAGAEYVVLSANAAPFPAVSGAPSCPYDSAAVSTAPRTPLSLPPRAEVRWLQEYRTPLTELRNLRANDCRFDALLRYARVPYVTAASPPPSAPRVAGDLRYDRAPGLDFADLPLSEPRVCPRFVPGWKPPRAALFEPPEPR